MFCTCIAQAQNAYRTNKDISYVSGSETDTYRLERCKLDIYYPENKKDFSTIVWFHGGGMEGGNKFIPKELREQGFAVVAADSRSRFLPIQFFLKLKSITTCFHLPIYSYL